jgi:cyclopropane-fatty-acyl-phospholipid synthase
LSLNGLWASERKPSFGVASNPKRVAVSRASSEGLLREAFEAAGIRINGANPWDIQVADGRFYDRVIAHGSLGLGETYVEGWWDCQQIDEAVRKIMEARLERHFADKWQLGVAALQVLRARIVNLQSERRAAEMAKVHYDLGAEFFRAMLGPTMVYSCGYWKDAENLDRAQEDKLELICRKLQIRGSDRVLDVGCGWGGFLKHIAARLGCASTGITISAKQSEYAKEFCNGLPVQVLHSDYRAPELKKHGRFDKVVSVGMFEHVGRKNYRTFFKIIDSLMNEDGLFLLQTIGRCRPEGATDLWMNKYIFPNGMLPSAAEIAEAIEGHFVIEDWHNFGADYDRTLMAWHANFEANAGSCEEARLESFRRMWRYYLLCCAGSFRARQGPQLWQIVMSKGGVAGGYRSVR